LYYEDVRAFLATADWGFEINAFQLLLQHFDTRDALILRIATSQSELDRMQLDRQQLEAQIVSLFNVARPLFAQALEQNMIHPLSVEWVAPGDIEINARTGKLRRVIDQRR
jgi:phenylacetate-CoA ligase